MQQVIVLGAGASKADGAPLQFDLLRDYFLLERRNAHSAMNVELRAFFRAFLGGVVAYANEVKMAERLVGDMAIDWEPSKYHDTYRDDLLKLIEEKAAGHVRKAPRRARPTAEVVDFAKLLEKSLAERKRGGASKARKATHDRAAHQHRRAA